jgi:hypothetical protein
LVNTQSSEIVARLEGITRDEGTIRAGLQEAIEGQSRLNGAWAFNGDPNMACYSFEYAKHRFILSGAGGRTVHATYYPERKTIVTDAYESPGWPANHEGIVGDDGNSITWQGPGLNATWTR